MTSMPFEPSTFHVDDLPNLIYGTMGPFAPLSLSWTDASVNAMELSVQWMTAAAIPYVQCMNAWMTFATSMSGIANSSVATPASPAPTLDVPPAKTTKVKHR